MNNVYWEKWQAGKWDLPVVPLEDERLNPFRDEGVEFHFLLGNHAPDETLKFAAVSGILKHAAKSGALEGKNEHAAATSGAFGRVAARVCPMPMFGASKVTLVMKEDVPEGKRRSAFFAGATIVPPEEGLSTIATAQKMGQRSNVFNLDQYTDYHVTDDYREIVAPHVWGKLHPDVLVSPVGTGGTFIGLADAFKNFSDGNTFVVGAMCASGAKIPGMRDVEGMAEIRHPWQKKMDEAVEVGTEFAYLSALWFQWGTGVASGVSGGASLAAMTSFIVSHRAAGDLDRFRGSDGRIRILGIVHDGFMPYLDRFSTVLSSKNKNRRTAETPYEFLRRTV